MPPPAPDAEIQAAARLLTEGRLPEALRRLGALTAAAPAYAAAHVLQAKALEADGRPDEALAAWHRAHFLVPTSPLVRRERQRLLDAFADAETYAPVTPRDVTPREEPAPESPAARKDTPSAPPAELAEAPPVAPAEPPALPPADVGAPVMEAPPSIAATALPVERPVPAVAWVSAPAAPPAPPVVPPPAPAGPADVPGGEAEDVFGPEDVFGSEAVFTRRADASPSEGTPDEAVAEASPASDDTQEWGEDEGDDGDATEPAWIEPEALTIPEETPADADEEPAADEDAEEAPMVYAEAEEAEILPVGEGPAGGLPEPPAAEDEDPFAGWILHHVEPAEPEDGGQGWTVLDETDAPRPEPPAEAEVAAPTGASLGRTPPDLTGAPGPERVEDAPPEAPDVADELDALIRQLADAPRIRPDPHFEPPTPAREEEDDGLDDDLVSETLARIYAAQRQYAEAAVIYEKLARQRPESADDYLRKAAELRTRGGPPDR